MSEAFDPYYLWLGIPRDQQPADYYRLFGLERFEDNKEAIENAAKRQIRHVETFKDGAHSREAEKLLQKLAIARACLSNSDQKSVYDRAMRGTVVAGNSTPVASGDRQAKVTKSRSRPRTRNPLVEVAKIVLGGIAGVVIANAILWYGFTVDVFGVMESRDEHNVRPIASNDEVQPSSSPQGKTKDLKREKVTQLPLPDLRPNLKVEPTIGQLEDSNPITPDSQESTESTDAATPWTPRELPLERGPPSIPIAPFASTEAWQYQQVWADYLGVPVEFTNSIGMKLRLMPPGAFLMGASESERGRRAERDENQHRVVITKPYFLSTTEVTQQQYQEIMGNKRAEDNSKHRETHPVVSVNWIEARAFCKKLALRDGRIYRLPTEAEWEYACRSGTTTPYSTGAHLTSVDANFNAGHSVSTIMTSEVGTYAANPFGLSDMMGNAREWCYDVYTTDYFQKAPLHNPVNSQPQELSRVVRGGSFMLREPSCRSAARQGEHHDTQARDLSFRVACQVTPRNTPQFPVEPNKPHDAITGFSLASVNCGVSAKKIDLNRVIDPSEDWAISIEFTNKIVQDDLQRLMTWGDSRSGRDVFSIALSKSTVSGWICDCRSNESQYFSHRITHDVVERWTRVTVQYESDPGRLFLFVDGKLVDAEATMVRPVLDKPSPACLGGTGIGEGERFTGLIRNFWMTNVLSSSFALFTTYPASVAR